ncbi:MAG: ribonuclease HI [Burkholderiaceae bacterium]|nr:ribonuclease HI [Burkholderiaceae bacterium]
MTRVQIYTDGACKGNPGPGGWGVLMVSGEHRRELHGGEPQTTNNRMELTAVIRALEAMNRAADLDIHTDSQYVQKGVTEWLRGWKAKGWRTAAGKPVKNVDLWQSLDALLSDHRIRWHWVRGHAGHPGNERADALANLGVAQLRQ